MKILALTLALAAAALALPASASAPGDTPTRRVELLEQQAGALTSRLDAITGTLGTFVAIPATRVTVQVAQSQEAQLVVRVSNIEEQMRNLTGQVEGIQYALTQMQLQLERMVQDNDFRFQQLEGGAPTTVPPQGQPTGTPVGALPTAPAAVAPAVVARPPVEQASLPVTTSQPNQDLTQALGTTPPTQLGEERLPVASAGPVPPANVTGLGAGPVGGFQLGAPERPLGTLSQQDLDAIATGGARSLDQSFETQTASLGDADAQYRAGYDAVVRGDYAFAEEQFRQFVALYPNHASAPDAVNWLGDAMLQRGAYDEAVDVLFAGFQNYPDATRAPDILLRLGMAMAGAEEHETACRTFSEVSRRYPNQPAAFVQRVAEERAKASC
jgi:tol-pal system protein YbgF